MSFTHLLAFTVFVLGIGYFFSALYLISQNVPRRTSPASLPHVDVLIAMRNEAQNILACLQSLKEQTYPAHLFEVYILDDRSTDGSTEIVREFIQSLSHFHLLPITEDLHGLSGKMNALAQGMSQSQGEIILITDADCIVPNSWIATQIEYFSADTGLVGALTMLAPPPDLIKAAPAIPFFGKIQALDWLFLQTIAASASHAGKPITVLGNNFAFRRSAYNSVNGFEGIGFSVTEDFALMRALERQGKWQIRHTLDPGSTIFSKPLKGLSDFISQRLRWVKGGRKARPFGYFIMGLSLFTHISILLVFIYGVWTTPAAVGVGLTFGVNYLIIKRELRRLKMNKLLKYFLPFQLFHMLYLPLFALLAAMPLPVRWKGRRFK